MNIILIATAVVVVITASVLGTRNNSEKQEPVPSETASTEEQTPTSEPTVTPVETIIETSTPSPTPQSTQVPSSSNSDWQYPNSKIVSDANTLIMTSSDSTDAITDWYKSKIENEGYNVRNSVKTSANDVVKNVVQAANSQGSISVEITKNPDSAEARIEVETSI